MLVVLITAILLTVGIVVSYKCLTVSSYTLQSDRIKNETRMVMISDLHNSEFGKNNTRLIEKIKDQKPDIILVVGDMINAHGQDAHVATGLIKNLVKIAPVYYSLGNHEENFMANRSSDIVRELEQAGAVVLDKEYQDIQVKGNKIRIGGIYDYAFALDGEDSTKKEHMDPKIYGFLKDFESTDVFRCMMAHRPDSFIFGEAAQTWNIDLVVSGHDHGGQIILPVLGGVFGGDQGLFPEYVDGIHHFKTVKNMIITRGLGSQKEKLPRFNNIPEIVDITLKSK
ncbi:metallophosphoesterase [Anaerostipes faecalis]|uniref:metallophosphoesterase n=1 Tax=Anaerostipes faecalis TaxID=2738446 RepID=UPI001E4A2773|nr:metallophosphoesterase [Anaerostipes faecalis]